MEDHREPTVAVARATHATALRVVDAARILATKMAQGAYSLELLDEIEAVEDAVDAFDAAQQKGTHPMTTDEIRRLAIGAAAMAIAKMAPREGYDEVPLTEIFPTPRARYQFLHEHYMAAAEAAIDAYEAAMWRPISEAPKDHTLVLVWDGREVTEDFYAPRDPWTASGDEHGHRISVTHFQPMPRPPSAPRGLFAQLTTEQQAAALSYDGPEAHGDPAFLLPTPPQDPETKP